MNDTFGDGAAEGITLSNLSFFIGLKGGGYKPKQSKVKGTSNTPNTDY